MRQERLHRAVNTTDMGWNPDREKDIDILAAMGISDRFGNLELLGNLLTTLQASTRSRSLFYMPGQDRYQQDVKTAYETLSLMCRFGKTFRGIRDDQRDFLAAMAITEWLEDKCRACNGAREIVREVGGKITCETCHGGGLHFYTDGERLDTLANGLEGAKDWDKLRVFYKARFLPALTAMHGILPVAIRASGRSADMLLERLT